MKNKISNEIKPQEYKNIACLIINTYLDDDALARMHYNYVLHLRASMEINTQQDIIFLQARAIAWVYDIQNMFIDLANCYLREYVTLGYLNRVTSINFSMAEYLRNN